ncbi:MAG: hypothetical protein IJG09_06430 [Methanobrevibacter sp.]|nr:hypothetical protein [Methanobrevibacter sp.]
MSNFDFLKSFNNQLYEIGVKLEEDVIDSPRAVTADATQFLETLVKDIYKLSNNKLDSNLISFYKKIDNLYRSGEISYIYKNKLQEAYNLRNKIHNNYQNPDDEIKLALDLHKRLFYISKKYFTDYCDNKRFITIPEYKVPQKRHIHFDNCIICGRENKNQFSNMCDSCNLKIDNLNLVLSIKNTFEDSGFTKGDLLNYGLSESEVIYFLADFSKENILVKKGEIYHINDDKLNQYLAEIDEYIEIGLLITKFYNDEITSYEVKSTLEYWKGSINQKPFVEFYRLVNLKLEKNFEENLLKHENIEKSMKLSEMDELNINVWFNQRKIEFINGDLNDAFILFNEILIKDFFKYKKRNMDEKNIKHRLNISDDIYDFWQNSFMGEDFLKRTNEIKKELILKEIKNNKSLKEALSTLRISENDFNRLFLMSKNQNDDFYKKFNKEYTLKRQKTFIKHLKNNNLNKAIRISKITKNEFYKWYRLGEAEYSEFYLEATEILMKKYLRYKKRGLKKEIILKQMNIKEEMLESWFKHKDLTMTQRFIDENARITSNILKRGKIINGLKEDLSVKEAISSAQLTPNEFLEIYNTSKREKTDFHIRFDEEFVLNRKRLFPKLLETNDFYNSIQKCEISQKDFHSWYSKDQDKYIVTNRASKFYFDTTQLLMDKYLDARKSGKNKPDAARSVGLSNNVINKWLNNVHLDLFYKFSKKNDLLERDLIIKGFKDFKTIKEVSSIYDISVNVIKEFINLGKSGFMDFREVFELYEDCLIPNLLDNFLDNFKTKSYSKSLKTSKITEKELEYYYEMGKSGNEKFEKFSQDYLTLKIVLYVNTILSKKSKKIALKNSNLTNDELNDNQERIDDLILKGRFNIIGEAITKKLSSGTKLAKLAGISLEEIYDWYLKGRDGDEKFKDFSLLFELGVIIPRAMAINHAKDMGVPKNWLYKKLKKELGSAEFKIWDENGFITQKDRLIKLDDDTVDVGKIMDLFKNSEFLKCFFKDDDPDLFNFMKNILKRNTSIQG